MLELSQGIKLDVFEAATFIIDRELIKSDLLV